MLCILYPILHKKLSSSHAERGQAIMSAVAYSPIIHFLMPKGGNALLPDMGQPLRFSDRLFTHLGIKMGIIGSFICVPASVVMLCPQR